MSNSIVRSFLVAQALVGVVLTILWLAGQWESRFMASPLFGISAVLLLCAFLPNTWIRTFNQPEHAAIYQRSEEDHPSANLHQSKRFAGWNRFSIDFILTSAFISITALLLHYVAPVPGV